MEQKKTLKKNILCFSLGTIGRDALYCFIANYLLTFVLFTRQLTAGQLAAITGIMIAARIFDALNDPIMGNIIEHTQTKIGKFKPWLIAGCISTSIVVYLMFNVPLQGWAFVVFFGVMYFLFSITYTMNDISYWGMIPALSTDGNERDTVTARATLFAGIGNTMAAVLIPMFTAGDKAIGGSATVAYGRIALCIAIITPVFLAITVLGVKERRDPIGEKKKFSFKEVFTTITRNDQLMWVALVFLIQQTAQNLILGGIGGTFIYLTFGYDGSLYSLFTTVGVSATALLMIFYPNISKRIKRKKLMNIMFGISLVGYILLLAFGFMPGAEMGKFYGVVVGYMLSNFGQYSYYLILMISLINTVEYNELKFGTRDEAVISSLRPFVTKMASALVVGVTTLTYLVFGITNYTNQISNFEQLCTRGVITEAEKLESIQAAISGVDPGKVNGLLIVMALIPCIMMFIANMIYQKKFIIDEDEYERICGELEK